jgi:PEP-CTERM motif-containing protein
MARVGRIAILTLICCGVSFTTGRASAGGFEITHFTSYVHMPLPGTLGESVTFDWSVDASDNGLSGLPGVADATPVMLYGTANLGPLISLDAEWDADGSIGYAEYLFGEGNFALELAFDLLDGTPHTMKIRGALGPTSVRADDYSSNDIILSLLHAKVDPKSAALFGMKRQISGSTYYYTDVYNMGSPDRELALFGYVYFDYTPVKSHKSADLTAVPEPATLVLTGLGVAATMRRRRG